MGKKDKNKFTFVEMFVGAGGSHLGFKKQGDFQTLLVSDINGDMCNAFSHNNKDVPNVICDNIHNLSGKDLMKKIKADELDVIFGGVVCKGFSMASVRSSADPRNILYQKFISLVADMRPKVAIIENVPGMASMMIRNGHSLPNKEQKKIDEAWNNLKLLNGIKSAITKGQADKAQINQVKDIEREKTKYRNLIKHGSTNVIEDIKRLYAKAGYNVLEPRILDASHYGAATTRKRLVIVAIRGDLDSSKFEFPKRTSTRTKTVGEVFKGINYEKTDKDNEPMNHAEKSKERFRYIPEGKNIVSVMHKLPENLKISEFYSRGCTMRLSRNKPSPTLVPGHSNFPVHPTEDRSITVREAACLMGFPKNYKFIGSHTTRCEQVGQAVVVEMAEAIAKSTAKFLSNQSQS